MFKMQNKTECLKENYKQFKNKNMNLKPVEKVLFLDIETVPQYETYATAPEELQKLFSQRYEEDIAETGSVEDVWNEKASLQPEFGKVVCVSVGMIHNGNLFKKSFTSIDEVDLLDKFVNGKLAERLNDVSGGTVFCAYSGETFDFPFLAKRLIINGLMVPKFLFYTDKKPWERNFLVDLKNIWKWEVYNATISLKLLGYSLGVGSGDEINGSMIKDIYYNEHDLKKISAHCENDIDLLHNSYIKLFANFANA